ncbi:MAG: glutamate 5-kinase [Phycisphaerales bacterium JB063]
MPSTQLRNTTLREAKRLVVKVGTQLITKATPDGPGIDTAFISALLSQIKSLRSDGREVVLVCSGAIGAGCAELGLAKRPKDVATQQAVAAVGQRKLMSHLHTAAKRRGMAVGQVLLTRADFDDRARFLNIRNCITTLTRLDVLPVLNENDTVAVDELRFGDNDMLAALTANALRADAMVLLTSVAGLLDGEDRVIDWCEDPIAAQQHAKQASTTWGTGGIAAKLDAVRVVCEAGELAVIAPGRRKNVLVDLMRGEKIGTVFTSPVRARPSGAGLGTGKKLDSRERWIALTARPAGSVTVDDGAAKALTQRGKSLLASGITDITGRFDRGDVLMVRDTNGKELARGLSNYTADELALIKGRQSAQFEKLLGRPAYTAVVHRDNMVLAPGLGNGEG